MKTGICMSFILGYFRQKEMTKFYENLKNFILVHFGPFLSILGKIRIFLENPLLSFFFFCFWISRALTEGQTNNDELLGPPLPGFQKLILFFYGIR